jgi:hypothetical protein
VCLRLPTRRCVCGCVWVYGRGQQKKEKEEESRIEDITEEAPAASPSAAAPAGSSSSAEGEKKEDDGEGTGIVPVHNGAIHDTYRWTQTLQDLMVSIPVPAGTKAKHLVIEIKKTKLVAKIGGKDVSARQRGQTEDCARGPRRAAAAAVSCGAVRLRRALR